LVSIVEHLSCSVSLISVKLYETSTTFCCLMVYAIHLVLLSFAQVLLVLKRSRNVGISFLGLVHLHCVRYCLYHACFSLIPEKLKKGEKRQIPVPMDKGRNMLGVLDETGTLEYGEVYVQYTCMKTQNLVTLTGEIELFEAKTYLA